MPKMIITYGLPGSGKAEAVSEFMRKNNTFVHISRGELRKMFGGTPSKLKLTPKNEEHLAETEKQIIAGAVAAKKNIIIADMFLEYSEREEYRKLAKEYSYTFEVWDFLENFKNGKSYTSEYFAINEYMEQCKEQNRLKPFAIPDIDIEELAKEYYFKHSSYSNVFQEGRRNCIIVDVDGTIAHHTHRMPYDLTRVITDEPDSAIIELVKMEKEKGTIVIVMSGREDRCKEDTVKWLQNNNVPYDMLLMRESSDKRSDEYVKHDLFIKNVYQKYNVLRVYDDRDRVCKMWRRCFNLKVLQVQEGNY